MFCFWLFTSRYRLAYCDRSILEFRWNTKNSLVCSFRRNRPDPSNKGRLLNYRLDTPSKLTIRPIKNDVNARVKDQGFDKTYESPEKIRHHNLAKVITMKRSETCWHKLIKLPWLRAIMCLVPSSFFCFEHILITSSSKEDWEEFRQTMLQQPPPIINIIDLKPISTRTFPKLLVSFEIGLL